MGCYHSLDEQDVVNRGYLIAHSSQLFHTLAEPAVSIGMGIVGFNRGSYNKCLADESVLKT